MMHIMINRSLVFAELIHQNSEKQQLKFTEKPNSIVFQIFWFLMVTSQCPDSANFLTEAKLENLNYSEIISV